MEVALLRDEAIAVAKSHGHDAVEPRHVLAALLDLLGTRRPPELDAAFVKTLLGPAGSAWQTPKPSDAAEALLAELAKASPDQAVEIAKRVAANPSDTPPPSAGAAGPTPDGGAAAVEHPPTDGTADAATTQTPTSPVAAQKESTQEILAELDSLVGLAAAKEAVRRAMASRRSTRSAGSRACPSSARASTWCSSGTAGTGKTTVARIVARHVRLDGAALEGPPGRDRPCRPRRGLRRPDRDQESEGRSNGARRRAVHRRGLRAGGRRLQRLRRRGDRDARQAHGGPPQRPRGHRRRLSRRDADLHRLQPRACAAGSRPTSSSTTTRSTS